MINEGGLVPTNFADVMEKFNQLVRKFAIKESEWLVQKGGYETKIAELEGQIKAHENINIDYLKRIRMLEYALSQERKKNKSADDKEDVKATTFLNEIQDNRKLLKEEDLKEIKAKSIRPSLISMLNDIGVNENLAHNLFIDLELNKTELEQLIKANMDQKLSELLDKNDNASINITGLAPLMEDKSSHVTTNPKHQEHLLDNKSNSQNCNLSFNKLTELKSHLDVVRKLGYLPAINSLVSVSEDCLIKVWHLNNLNYTHQHNDLEPYLILRGHTGPLFCLETSNDDSNIIYTAGNEGVIKIWKLPKPEEVPQYGDSDIALNCNIGFFQKEINEVVWDLKHHPQNNLLVSLNSDALLCIWETTTASNYINSFNEGNFDRWLKSSKTRLPLDLGTSELPIPTTCCFLKTDVNRLLTGFNDSYISIFDFNKNSFTSNIKTSKTERVLNRITIQPNCIVSANSVAMIYAGFEDSSIKSIDIRSESVIDSYTSHTDAVTSLNLMDDIYLFSTSHDRKVKLWDTRKMNNPIQETFGSEQKWDEAIWHSILIPKHPVLAVACADSVIKLFHL